MQQYAEFGHPEVVSGNVPGTEPTNQTHYPALDGLRAFAFLLVFLAHYYALPWGFGGVNIFFVLSGFLITGILWDSRDRPHRARTFYVRRTLRIFPLYYGVLLLVFFSTIFFKWQWSRPWLAWPLYLGNFLRMWGHGSSDPELMAQCYGWLRSARIPGLTLFFGHFWSLCVEEQFYLVWPWLVFLFRPRRWLLGFCAVIVVAEPLVRAFVQAHTAPWVTGRELLYTLGLPFQLDSLILGAFLALVWRGEHRAALQKAARGILTVLAVLLVIYIVYVFTTVHGSVRANYVYPRWRLTYGLSLIDVFGALLMVRALDPGSLVYRVFNNTQLRALGRVSYGAYVFHDLLHGFYIRMVLHLNARVHASSRYVEIEVAVLGLFSTIVLALLSFRYFEGPFLKLKEKLAPSHGGFRGAVRVRES